MEAFIGVVALMALAGVVAAVVLVARRRQGRVAAGTPPTTAAPSETPAPAPAAAPLAPQAPKWKVPVLGDELSEQGEGTTKIDRAALQTIIGGPSGPPQRAYFLVIAGEGIGRFIKLDRNEFLIGRDPSRADICFQDDAISSVHARVRVQDGSVVIEDLESSNGTFVDGTPIKESELVDGSRVVLGRSTVLTLTFQDELGEKFQMRMWESSTRDGLTKCYNKTTFLDLLASEMQFAKRHGTNFCLAVLDIDHFKQINDNYGHLVGDEVLSAFADVVRGVIRTEAMFARYGGEEFIVAERSASLAEGIRFAERIRGAVERHAFRTAGGSLSVTASIGIADLRCIAEPDATALIAAADKAVYEAKSSGRNRVCQAASVSDRIGGQQQLE